MKFQIKSEKNGYHSTQRTIYGRIPASEFYGFVLGIALGYIIRGVVNLSGLMEINNSDLAFVFCAIGVAIGWWYDQKYFMVKDEPEEGAEEAAEGAEAETAVSVSKAAAQEPAERRVIEGTSTQDTLRQMFARNINNSFITIDTSFLDEKEFRRRIEKYFSKSSIPNFSISFLSFGYKYGVPMDADLMIDVRFLPNPFWVVSLRPYSGNDKEVYDFVMEKPETQEFLEKFLAFTDYAFEQYAKEGKNHFTVAVGCTGGQHRSVAIANYLYEYYKQQYNCYLEHRDEKEWVHE